MELIQDILTYLAIMFEILLAFIIWGGLIDCITRGLTEYLELRVSINTYSKVQYGLCTEGEDKSRVLVPC